MTEGGDILLYGCFVAADGAGQAFNRYRRRRDRADIAASIDPTGADEIGGDWVLEHATGPIAESEVTTLLAASGFDDVLTGPVAGNNGLSDQARPVLGDGADVAVNASASTLLNGFDV